MHELQFLIITVIILALVFDFINGFHDTANAIADIIASRYKQTNTELVDINNMRESTIKKRL